MYDSTTRLGIQTPHFKESVDCKLINDCVTASGKGVPENVRGNMLMTISPYQSIKERMPWFFSMQRYQG
jgi:hypothetical protein